MRHNWADPGRRTASMAVAIYLHPGGLANSRLVKPAVVELENGHLVEIPLVLVDSDRDVTQMVKELRAFYKKTQQFQRQLPPTAPPKPRRGRPPKKK